MSRVLTRSNKRSVFLAVAAAGGLLLGFAGLRPSLTSATSLAIELCDEPQPGVHCGPGYGRKTAGGAGTGKVSHAGWPAITGELLIADDQGRRAEGSGMNDEILGGHGSDTLIGDAGRDVLWGDQHPTGNNTWQHDTLRGGSGNDLIYPSHGSNEVYAGSGADTIRAYYGHGTIDCGPGSDTAQVRLNDAYKLIDCEHVVHFCAYGSGANGDCRKPGETRAIGQPSDTDSSTHR